MDLNKQIATNAINDTIAIKWLLIFAFSDLLRAISVIKGKKNKQGPLIMTEDKSMEKSFFSFSHTIPGPELNLVSLFRCVRTADFGVSLREYLYNYWRILLVC